MWPNGAAIRFRKRPNWPKRRPIWFSKRNDWSNRRPVWFSKSLSDPAGGLSGSATVLTDPTERLSWFSNRPYWSSRRPIRFRKMPYRSNYFFFWEFKAAVSKKFFPIFTVRQSGFETPYRKNFSSVSARAPKLVHFLLGSLHSASPVFARPINVTFLLLDKIPTNIPL